MGDHAPGPQSPASPGRPGQMLAAYSMNLGRGPAAVRAMIVEDIRRFSELGAANYVRDLNEALFHFDGHEATGAERQ